MIRWALVAVDDGRVLTHGYCSSAWSLPREVPAGELLVLDRPEHVDCRGGWSFDAATGAWNHDESRAPNNAQRGAVRTKSSEG